MPLGAVVVTSYRPGAEWAPTEITRGQASLSLLNNTVAALERHTEALAVFKRLTQDALLLSGERGDASAVVNDLMARLA
jgi:hypothetical protein